MDKISTGSVSELLVASDYIKMGWNVYFPFDHNTEIDMLVTKGPRVKRVQVKTVYQCGDILRANIDHKKSAKYSPDTVDTLVAVYGTRTWSIPMEDIEGETTLNFGKLDGTMGTTRGNFDHTKYEVIKIQENT